MLLAVVAGMVLVASACVASGLGGTADDETDAAASSAAPVSPAATTAVPAPSVSESPAPTSSTPTAAADEGQLVRVVGVIDGDTIRVSIDGQNEPLRIIGIDTPELKGSECYAQRAASRVQSLVQSRDVHIVADPTQSDRDRYDRILRHVFSLDGTNVAETLVAEGLAREYTYDRPYAFRDDYLDAQGAAQAEGLGIWSGECDVAAAPGSSQPLGDPASDRENCVVKGNISRSGEKIYHVPGQRHYADTVINEGADERWFCTEDEAVEAGWRKALR